MAEVFAGFVSGYAMALLTAPLLAVLLFRARASGGILAAMLPAGTSPIALVVVLHGALFFVWSGLGIILGMLLYAMRDAESAPLLPNPPFTLFVAALTVMVVAPLLVLLPRFRQAAFITAASVLLVFGLLMPNLAGWTRFGSA